MSNEESVIFYKRRRTLAKITTYVCIFAYSKPSALKCLLTCDFDWHVKSVGTYTSYT